jgi:hypothetical protein
VHQPQTRGTYVPVVSSLTSGTALAEQLGMKPLIGLVLLVGCADTGALGNATVTPECSPTDFACVTTGLDGPIAAGGVLPLSIDADALGSSTATMTLLSADPSVLKAAGTEVVGVTPGVAALVMLSEGHAIDFLHVFVVEPNRLGLHRVDDGLERAELVDGVELLPGDELILEAEPYRDSQRLLGHGTTTWSGGGAVSVLRDGAPARRRIVARTPGEADVVVGAFGFTRTLHITVLP